MDHFTLLDNANGLAANGGFPSQSKKYPYAEVTNTVIVGKALPASCGFCYDNPQDCETNGLYTSVFESTEYTLRLNEYLLPLHNVTFTDFLWGGRQSLDKVEFRNFKPREGCAGEKAFAIRTNNFVQDTSVYFQLKEVAAVDVARENSFFFANHTRPTHPCYCSKRDCTGIYNILIDDRDGAFASDGQPSQFFGHNRPIAREGNCEFVPAWNGHECQRDFQL